MHKQIQFLFVVCILLRTLHLRKDRNDSWFGVGGLEACWKVLRWRVDKADSDLLWSDIDSIAQYWDMDIAKEEECGLNGEAMVYEFTKYNFVNSTFLINRSFDNFSLLHNI